MAPVAVSRTLIAAPGTTFPVGSFTVPEMPPLVLAHAKMPEDKTTARIPDAANEQAALPLRPSLKTANLENKTSPALKAQKGYKARLAHLRAFLLVVFGRRSGL